jgi:hypothetical protein
MLKIVETDDKITLSVQLEDDAGPVILMNKFNVGPDEVEEFLKVFEETTKYFKQQPGFISAQLHRGLLAVPHSLTMWYKNVQHILNRHLITLSFDHIWPIIYQIL